MRLDASQHMRMEQRMKLAPRMIQSMEILQLPLMALEERIEQELQNNPVLEQLEADGEAPTIVADEAKEGKEDFAEDEKALIVKEDSQAADFERLEKISEYLENED